MKVIYLHVGMPKTGSSAIQNFLAQNAEELKGLGYYVPQYGFQHVSHFTMAGTLVGLPPPSPRHKDAAAIIRDLDQWPEAVVLSSERFAAFLQGPDGGALLEGMRAIGAHVVIIAYVRNQAQLMNSGYSQNVKNLRFLGSFDEYLESRIRQRSYKFIAAAQRHGAELRIRPYSPEVRRNNVVADFLRTIGISTKASLPSARVNESPGPFRIEAARRILSGLPETLRNLTERQSTEPKEWLASMIDDLLVTEPPYCGLTTEKARAIDVAFAGENDTLAMDMWGSPWADVFADDVTQEFEPNDYQITGVPSDKVEALDAIANELTPKIATYLSTATASKHLHGSLSDELRNLPQDRPRLTSIVGQVLQARAPSNGQNASGRGL